MKLLAVAVCIFAACACAQQLISCDTCLLIAPASLDVQMLAAILHDPQYGVGLPEWSSEDVATRINSDFVQIFYPILAQYGPEPTEEQIMMAMGEAGQVYCANVNFCVQPPIEPPVSLADIVEATKNVRPTPFWPIKPSLSDNRILVLSDIHLDRWYARNSLASGCAALAGLPEEICCSAAFGPGDAGKYGELTCGSPLDALKAILSYYKTVNAKESKVGGKLQEIVLLGDMTAPQWWNETREDTVVAVKAVYNAVRQYFSGIPVHVVVGNHEAQFIGQIYESGDWVYPALLDIIKHELTPEMQATFLQGGYYAAPINEKLTAIVLNTQLGSYSNFHISIPREDMGGQLAWLSAQLAQAKRQHKKVIIYHHIPWQHPDMSAHYVEHTQALFEQYADIIVTDVSGHNHHPALSVMRDKATNSKPLMLQIQAGSVTAEEDVEPSFEVLRLNRALNSLVDYEHHQMNLERSNKREMPVIKLKYSALQRYGLRAMLPNDVQVRNNKASTTDVKLRNKITLDFQTHVSAKPERDPVWILCSTQTSRPDQFNQCVANTPPFPGPETKEAEKIDDDDDDEEEEEDVTLTYTETDKPAVNIKQPFTMSVRGLDGMLEHVEAVKAKIQSAAHNVKPHH